MRVRTVVVVFVALLLAAGSPGGPGLAQGKPTLRMLASAGGSGASFAAGVSEFERDTGIKVDFIQAPYAEVREKQLLELTSGSGTLDIVSVDDQVWLPELFHYLEPLEPYVRRDSLDLNAYVPAMLNLYRYTDPVRNQSALYALPIRVGGFVLIYRKDLLQQAGIAQPPRTMDEFLADARALTHGGQYGIAFALKQTNYLTSQFFPILRSFGADVLDHTRAHPAFNTPLGREATQFFVDLYRKYKVIPQGAITYEQDSVIAAMQQGLTAMTITYSPYVVVMNNPKASKFAGQFTVASQLPYSRDSGLKTGVTMINGWGFGVSRDSRSKDAAWQFVKYMASPKAQDLMAIKYANSPTLKEVYQNREFQAVFPEALPVLSVLDHASSRTGVVQWTRIEDIMSATLSAALVGDKSVPDALADAERQVTQILRSAR